MCLEHMLRDEQEALDFLLREEFEMRSDLSDLPVTSGIYKITCTANKRIYIGSALNLRNRRIDHFCRLRRNIHQNPKLQRAWNKYGEQSFTFEILELVLPMSLTAREQYWFNKLKPFGNKGFNIAREAGSNLGVKQSPERIEKTRKVMLGRKQSLEQREKTRQNKLGNKYSLGRKHTPKELEKMRTSQIGNKRSPEAVERTRQGNLGKKRSPEICEKFRLAQQARRAKEKKEIT